MKKVIFDGEEFHEIPGFQGYFVSTGLKVIKDTRDVKRVRYANQYRPVSIWIRNGKPYVSMHVKGKDYAKPVLRLLYMAQMGYTDQVVRHLQKRASFIQLSDGTVKMVSTDDISRVNLEKAKEAMKRIREEVTPAKTLAELRRMERLFSTLIEEDDPKPIMKYLEQIRDNEVIPYLIRRDYGRFRATELAQEAMMETITSILKGYLPTNIPGYMKTVAKSLYKRQRMALQTQFAELYPGTEYDSAKDELENYYTMLYQ